MKITDGSYKDASDAYGRVVRSLRQLGDEQAVWASARWVLQRNQEVLVHAHQQTAGGRVEQFNYVLQIQTDDKLKEKHFCMPLGFLLP